MSSDEGKFGNGASGLRRPWCVGEKKLSGRRRVWKINALRFVNIELKKLTEGTGV